jgi:hypothetical protein
MTTIVEKLVAKLGLTRKGCCSIPTGAGVIVDYKFDHA